MFRAIKSFLLLSFGKATASRHEKSIAPGTKRRLLRLESLEERSLMTASGMSVQPRELDHDSDLAIDCVASDSVRASWHNAGFRLDVTEDGFATAQDALTVINYLNAFGPTTLTNCAASEYGHVDTVPDGQVTAADAAAVINFLNAFGTGHVNLRGGAEGEAHSADSQLRAEHVDLTIETGYVVNDHFRAIPDTVVGSQLSGSSASSDEIFSCWSEEDCPIGARRLRGG